MTEHDPAFCGRPRRSDPPRTGWRRRRSKPSNFAPVHPGSWLTLRARKPRHRYTRRDAAEVGAPGDDPFLSGRRRAWDTDSPRRHRWCGQTRRRAGKRSGNRRPMQKDHPGPSPRATAASPGAMRRHHPGSMIIPVDAWNKMLTQLGNLHEAGQQLAEARERAARAETEAQLPERATRRAAPTGRGHPANESPPRPRHHPQPEPACIGEKVWDYVMRRIRGWRRG